MGCCAAPGGLKVKDGALALSRHTTRCVSEETVETAGQRVAVAATRQATLLQHRGTVRRAVGLQAARCRVQLAPETQHSSCSPP